MIMDITKVTSDSSKLMHHENSLFIQYISFMNKSY